MTNTNTFGIKELGRIADMKVVNRISTRLVPAALMSYLPVGLAVIVGIV